MVCIGLFVLLSGAAPLPTESTSASAAKTHVDLERQSVEHAMHKWLTPMNWVRDREDPVLTIGEKGRFDDQHIFAPCVIRMNGEYWLYYAGSQNDVIGKGIYKPKTPLTDDQIARIKANRDKDRLYKVGLAKSKDGVHFERYNGPASRLTHATSPLEGEVGERSEPGEGFPVFSFGDGRTGVVTPSILRDANGNAARVGGKLVMFFTGVDMPGDYRHNIYRTKSADGLHWSAPSAVLVPNAYACHVMKDGRVYRIWYVDVSKRPWVIRYAESADLDHWTVEQKPCLVPHDQDWEKGDNVLVYPSVLKQDGVFVMLYGSYWQGPEKTAIGLAVSADGKAWTKFSGNPVFTPEPKHDWEASFTTSESWMRLPDGSFRLWYASRKRPDASGKEPGWTSMYYAIGTARLKGPGK